MIEVKHFTILKKLENYNLADAEPWFFIAQSYGFLNDIEGTVRCLKRAVDGGFFNYPLMINDIFFENVRDNSKFQKILEEAKYKHFAFKKELF